MRCAVGLADRSAGTPRLGLPTGCTCETTRGASDAGGRSVDARLRPGPPANLESRDLNSATDEVIEAGDLAQLDTAIEEVPNVPAVFVLFVREGAPYLARTGLLRRRLLRLLRERDRPSRLLNLRQTVARVEYWLTGSRLESSMRMYELARQHFPDEYLDYLHLRLPPYLKILSRTNFRAVKLLLILAGHDPVFLWAVSQSRDSRIFRIGIPGSLSNSPVSGRSAPSSGHPGCIYGEMGKCLRPCQQAVSKEEYAGEVERVVEFLRTEGASLLDNVIASRDRLSAAMEFEQAARQHKRAEKSRR